MNLGLVIAAAAVLIGFASYLRFFFDVPQRIGTWLLLGLVAVIVLFGIEQSARLTVALSTVQVAGLLAILAIGISHLGDENLIAGASTAGVVTAAALVFLHSSDSSSSSRWRKKPRTLPGPSCALLAALGISTVLYVGVAIAGISVLGSAALASSEQPLADVMGAAIGSRSAVVVAVVAMMTTTNTTLLAGPLCLGCNTEWPIPGRFSQASAGSSGGERPGLRCFWP